MRTTSVAAAAVSLALTLTASPLLGPVTSASAAATPTSVPDGGGPPVTRTATASTTHAAKPKKHKKKHHKHKKKRKKKQAKVLQPSATKPITVLPTPSTATPTPTPTPMPTPLPTVLPTPDSEATTACGDGITIIDATPYVCTFDDEFDETELDRTKWAVNVGLPTGGPDYACTVDDPRYINVADGALHLTMAKVDTPVPCSPGYAPASIEAPTISSYHLFSQQYGRFEARVRTTATTAPGLHEAFWLWPDDRYSEINWPTSGEIDVAETYSNYPLIAIPFLHYSEEVVHPPWTIGVNTAMCAAVRGVWNTYTLDWTATSITISINGIPCLVNTSADPAFAKRYIVALSMALGDSANAATAATPFPATTDVDYVRVWQRTS
ncbi:family 16 glycosylhydrolase [Nocardioides sp. Kera G14]|uniref:glycoside hydrolase family 16 protein n=1 Tax=Nocardioides sp. Kera G14 TaxID=2884264 RepID=UPI001D10F9B3|nr:glycoside hydrolase family 16 protein [Nocardioides sp. Kera G14]UDY22612.1 glycoside hydrolase family 16 protein [Nocardioides sp. Kera G14]